jgi:chromosome partitioning protein
MQTIVLASRKGGAGKTTLTSHLAVEAQRQGAGPVAVIDTDPMGGLASWWNERKAETPFFARLGEGGLVRTLADLERDGMRLVLIDTPPFATDSVSGIIAAADMVLVPVVPSPNDLRAIGETLEMVEQQRRPLVFVVNNAGSGKLTGQAAVALSQYGTVAPVTLRTRQDFRSSMIDGRTAGEIDPRGKSGTEIADLWRYMTGRLQKEVRHGATAAA